MKSGNYVQRAKAYLNTLCAVKPHRRLGSPGNREATAFVEKALRSSGYEVEASLFDCLDYECRGVELTCCGAAFEAYASPYSLATDVLAEMVAVSTVDELERTTCEGKILLLRGEICSEQLAPKNYVFYNPEHHQRIVALLEDRKPAAIVTATARNPELVGALYPFPLVLDGDFDIPSIYCRDTVGDSLAAVPNPIVRVKIDARRVPSSAANVIATLNRKAERKVVVTAHVDAYGDTPGALDNASGVVILLLIAEMMSDYAGPHCLEIAVLNGEDHYSAGGQMDYLRRYGDEITSALLAVNADGVGSATGRTVYSFYELPPELEAKADSVLKGFGGLARGEQWYSGDHMIFVQSGVPALAVTSESAGELLRTVVHTSSDTPDRVDCRKLVEVAEAVTVLVRSL